ncbi:transglutaminase family protein [Emticicia sp. CRIBPO]|uniref:transglutaminase family protein n=1 Tax=Emticicia sp. CRIBPO TaxID=2683258 RepID=UPI0014120BF1|nr:transglutaminase family protein [Emticicia sp. CRIBPO]NBA86937.1 transglutaminase family protein [Emticicia sp. CRIBPO]
MVLEIEHQLVYSYSESVSLTPHILYLTPRPTPYQSIVSHKIDIDPKPSLLVKNIDQEGNIQHICFVNEGVERISIKATMTVDTQLFNSFDFVFYPFESNKLPFVYPDKAKPFQETYINNKKVDESVKKLGIEIAEKVNFSTMDFLINLCQYINENFRYEMRERGVAYDSKVTLELKSGSCRDFSVLMMDVCSSMGIMARFVSGYFFGSELHEHELHAWVEVLLPGGGWRGFDPTEGKVVNHNYIALASSIEAEWINPVRGNFRSKNVVKSELSTHVAINRVDI